MDSVTILRIRRFAIDFVKHSLYLLEKLHLRALSPSKEVTKKSILTPHYGAPIISSGETINVSYKIKNLSFIHIGKCGGTSIKRSFLESGVNIDAIHIRRAPTDTTRMYFFWIRNPISRFVSAFNYSKAILNFDLDFAKSNHLTVYNSPDPEKIRLRIRTGSAFRKDYERLMSEFGSANELAEALNSPNSKRSSLANRLMLHPTEHIAKGLGWYLYDGLWVDKFASKILFVGSMENIHNDFDRLLEKLEIPELPQINLVHARASSSSTHSDLSERARRNIFKFYRKTDYAVIDTLYRRGLITEMLYESYVSSKISDGTPPIKRT